MEMNPATATDDAEEATEAPEKYVPPTDSNELKFIKLAKSMKRLSPDTIEAIEDDLQPEEADKKEDAAEGDNEEEDIVTSTPSGKDPRSLLIMGLSKVLGIPTK